MSEVLFTSTPTPALPDVNESQNVTLGTTVVFAVSGTVSGIQFMSPVTISGTFDGVLWQATADDAPASSGTGTVLATASFGTPSSASLTTCTFSSPVAVTAGVTYVCGMRTSAGRYPATGAFFTSALVVGNITAVQDQSVTALGTMANGRFIGGSITLYPTDTFNSNGYFIGPIFDATVSSTVAPTGVSVAVGLGTPTAGNTMDAAAPSGIAVARALGTPTAAQTFSVTPSGVAVPVALGQPAAGNGMDVVAPGGIPVARALGTPTLVQTFTSVPSGISVPTALGQPSVAQLAGAGFPSGVAVTVALGAPTVVGQPYVPPVSPPGGWWQLKGLLDAARVIRRDEQARQPVACPNDGEPLRVSIDGIVYCPFDNYIYGDRSRAPGRGNGGTGRDWGGLAGVIAGAEADTFSAAVLEAVACPNDGEPLSYSKDGTVFCRFDGWRPDGGAMPLNPNQ